MDYINADDIKKALKCTDEEAEKIADAIAQAEDGRIPPTCMRAPVFEQLGIENIGDGGWATNGWAKVKREWETVFRTITMEGYAVIFISHSKDKTFKPKNAAEYNQIVPSCSTAYNEIIKNKNKIYPSIQ